jgi:hypothetical protein
VALVFMIADVTPFVATPMAAPCPRVAAGWSSTGVAASPASAAFGIDRLRIDRLRPLAGTFAGTFDKQVRPPRGIPR